MTGKLSGADQIYFHLFWHFVKQQLHFSTCCVPFEISFISLPPLTVLTGARCKPLTIIQEAAAAAAALNRWMYAHHRQASQRQQTLWWCLEELLPFPRRSLTNYLKRCGGNARLMNAE